MKNISILLIIFAFALAAQTAKAQSKAEKERSDFLRNSKLLERKPFDPNAEAVRSIGFKWLVETDQVSVTICSGIMKLNPEKKNKFKGELLMQMTFGMAVFKLENPDKKNDEKAASLAGVESMLRTYAVMLSENEKARNAELDSLVAKEKGGELKSVVDAAFDAGKCDK